MIMAPFPYLAAVTTLYVRKEEEKVYNALLLDSLTIHELKIQVCQPAHSAYTE